MSMEWTETERKIMDEDTVRNLRIIRDSNQLVWALTHPRLTHRFIRSNRPHPPSTKE